MHRLSLYVLLQVVCGRWKVLSRLGAGGCGSVYKVEDLKHKGYVAALKAEAIVEDDSGVLKLEAAVLKKLADRKNVIRLLMSGKRTKYSLCQRFAAARDRFRAPGRETWKHDERSKRSRQADNFPDRLWYGAQLRRTKRNNHHHAEAPEKRAASWDVTVLLAQRSSAAGAANRQFQGRVDDLWAMIYMLGELYVGLPWNRITVEKEIIKIKESETDENVFRDCPEEFIAIAKYLRTLTYQDRPDYHKIYNLFIGAMKREKYSFTEKYEWEEDVPAQATHLDTAIDYSSRELMSKKPLEGFEKEALLYTNIHEKNFKEVILTI
ncbi:unnamed protein product [Nippostrongylus brasiliensis]|uniref:Protein kinase domain-containing protein n=1 Tax=Nippostrongylus brasiliensis TaxID=27835 RepID=A0A0N4YRV1_NIPBR|nr:unnamed protein product [Nippostrongylus brasiliensis]